MQAPAPFAGERIVSELGRLIEGGVTGAEFAGNRETQFITYANAGDYLLSKPVTFWDAIQDQYQKDHVQYGRHGHRLNQRHRRTYGRQRRGLSLIRP